MVAIGGLNDGNVAGAIYPTRSILVLPPHATCTDMSAREAKFFTRILVIHPHPKGASATRATNPDTFSGVYLFSEVHINTTRKRTAPRIASI